CRRNHTHQLGLRAPAFNANAFQQFLAGFAFEGTVEQDFVFLFDFKTRMREVQRKLAIIRQNQQPFAFLVETSDVKNARPASRQQIENRAALMRVSSGAEITARLVDQDVEKLFGDRALAVHLHKIVVADFGGEICANLAVDRDTGGADEFFTAATRAEAGGGEVTIETHRATMHLSRL